MVLDIRERAFMHEYIINSGNAYQAAIKAGYKKSTAKNAYEWLLETLPDPTKTRHLPYKPELETAIQEELKRIEDAKIADEIEILQYLTSVMRKESLSESVVVEGCGDGVSRASVIDKHPDEREAMKAAELLGKTRGMFKDKVDMNADMELNITIDYGDGD